MIYGVPEGIYHDIVLDAEVGTPTGQIGTMKSFADPGYPLSQRADILTPGCSRSVHPKICLAGPVTTSSVGRIVGFDGSAGGNLLA